MNKLLIYPMFGINTYFGFGVFYIEEPNCGVLPLVVIHYNTTRESILKKYLILIKYHYFIFLYTYSFLYSISLILTSTIHMKMSLKGVHLLAGKSAAITGGTTGSSSPVPFLFPSQLTHISL